GMCSAPRAIRDVVSSVQWAATDTGHGPWAGCWISRWGRAFGSSRCRGRTGGWGGARCRGACRCWAICVSRAGFGVWRGAWLRARLLWGRAWAGLWFCLRARSGDRHGFGWAVWVGTLQDFIIAYRDSRAVVPWAWLVGGGAAVSTFKGLPVGLIAALPACELVAFKPDSKSA